MAGLRSPGVGVAIDDLGAGHPALASLPRLPGSGLKIDRAFVRDLGGVETAAQPRSMPALGCGRTRGFLHGRPLPEGACELPSGGGCQKPGLPTRAG